MASSPPIARSSPPKQSHYKKYREDLRSDFFYSCAYCSLMEREAGGVEFAIEHYVPKECDEGKPLEHEWENLLWACKDCNSYKGTFNPTAPMRAEGRVVIRPDTMVPSDHLDLDEDDPETLRGTTPTGQFTIAKLDLNRPGLKNIRRERIRIEGAMEFVRDGIRACRKVATDQLDVARRGTFFKLKETLTVRAKSYEQDLDELLREYARSPLRIPDPDKRNRARERKRQLELLTSAE